jgi:hypothetical protein
MADKAIMMSAAQAILIDKIICAEMNKPKYTLITKNALADISIKIHNEFQLDDVVLPCGRVVNESEAKEPCGSCPDSWNCAA